MAVDPFLQTGGVGEVVGVHLVESGSRVATVEATLTQQHIDQALHHRFTMWCPEVRDTPDHLFESAVDLARRQRLAWRGASICPPGDGRDPAINQVLEQCGMAPVPFCKPLDGPPFAKHSFVTSPDQYQALVDMIGKTQPKLKLLYRASVDGWRFADLLRCVGSASGLLFIIRARGPSDFACYIGCDLLCGDPKGTKEAKCPVWFSTLTYHELYRQPTRIDIRPHRRVVEVAGVDGWVANCAKVWIGGGDLMLGYTSHTASPCAPLPDLRRGRLRILADKTPGVRLHLGGSAFEFTDEWGNVLLTGSKEFTAVEMEVVHVT
mmetsp:Transcript_39657/g.113078  ORF Transcript_39657/g.113078 Transcript_39657/m.113078 type:complete len:321 (-) Transcript_39657:1451-2413(-)